METTALRRFAPALLIVAPLLLVGGARAFTFTDWAAANASIAALLFAWVIADTLGIVALTKAPRDRVRLRALLGALTLASLVILAGASGPVREAILAMPPLLAAMGLVGTLWVGWSLGVFGKALRRGASLEESFATILPPRLVHLAARESAAMRLALFRWRLVPDVPEGASAHRYDRYLAPMLWVFLGLQVVELGVVHLLLMQWSETVAWVMFALTMAGILWFVALIKSIRLKPVLLTDSGIDVRHGLLVDLHVPYDAIARLGESFDVETLKQSDTINCALMSAPNVTMTLARPVAMTGMLGNQRQVMRIALRLDAPELFQLELQRRLAH
ncbi:hypothetical protein [Sphingomicrobium aestuariivivum]|uniref:hypothetical protein n=1 Tax=Sphingomicrobium aestuariivivum TaxID=1582356 RepID=UPI001FD66DB5|nr:hypothetical protein [Sphingomicrobium aestuariivivum]MCJ8191660.1 hypothetical protein [Sphingomicrobium aestuariivivum]